MNLTAIQTWVTRLWEESPTGNEIVYLKVNGELIKVASVEKDFDMLDRRRIIVIKGEPKVTNRPTSDFPLEDSCQPRDEWPCDPQSGRLLCTPERPMPKGATGRWMHTNVKSVDSSSDYTQTRKCSDCEHSWDEELPE